MEILVINIKNKKDSKLIKELLNRLDIEVSNDQDQVRKNLPKSRMRSPSELRAMGGILKSHLISKEHIRNITWKKRVW